MRTSVDFDLASEVFNFSDLENTNFAAIFNKVVAVSAIINSDYGVIGQHVVKDEYYEGMYGVVLDVAKAGATKAEFTINFGLTYEVKSGAITGRVVHNGTYAINRVSDWELAEDGTIN